MKKYTYKNIILFQTCGRWHADYKDSNRFALHRSCCRTRKEAYNEAKEQVNYLNEKELNK